MPAYCTSQEIPNL